MGSRSDGTGFGVPGVINFMGEELLVLSQGDGVDLNTRVYLDGHQFGAISCWELEPGIKRYLAIRCTLCKQGSFVLGCGFDAVGKDHIYAVLGVLGGGLLVMGTVGFVGHALWEGMWEGMWDWLWLGLQQCNCLLG